MAVNVSRRNAVLGALLVATLAASAWTLLSGSDEPVVQPVKRPDKAAPAGAGRAGAPRAPAAQSAPGDLALGERPPAPGKIVNLFSAYSYQAPPATAGAAATAKPHAPPLPFTYTGRLEIDGVATYLMMQGDIPLSVILGGSIGEFTLVEAGSDHLVFEHGPTGERVALPTGGGGN